MILLAKANETNLKEGAYYDAEVLKMERSRINGVVRQAGYYEYEPEAITYKADTSRLNHNINLSVKPLSEKDGILPTIPFG